MPAREDGAWLLGHERCWPLLRPLQGFRNDFRNPASARSQEQLQPRQLGASKQLGWWSLLPAAALCQELIPCESTGTKQLLLGHRELILTLDHCRIPAIFFMAYTPGTPPCQGSPTPTRSAEVRLGLHCQVCSEANKTLAPLQMPACLAFCSFGSSGSPWERAGEPVEVWGGTP